MAEPEQYGGIFAAESQEYGGIFNDNAAQPEQVVDPVDYIPEPTVAEDYVAPVPEEEGKGFFGSVAEIPVNMAGAVGSFAKETVGTVIDWPIEILADNLAPIMGDVIATDLEGISPEELQLYNDSEGTKLFSLGSTEFSYYNGDQIQELKEANLYKLFKAEQVVEDLVFDLGDVKTIGMQKSFVGSATGGLTQFIAGWVALAPVKVLGLAKNATTVTKIGNAALKGAVVDFTVFDAHEARLSDFLKSAGLENDWINYLASKGNEDDSTFDGKMKNAMEGGVLGTSLDITFRTVAYGYRAIRSSKKAQDPSLTQAQRDEAAAKAVELQAKAEGSFKDPSEVELVTPDGTPVKVETPETVAVKFEQKVSKADPTKPRVDVEGNPVESRSPQNLTDAELDLATKAERAELGSLRSPDDVGAPKVHPIKATIEQGNKLIAKLLRDADSDDILGFVRSLKEVTIRPDGFEPAQWVKALESLNKSIDEALALVDDSVEFKAGDETAILRKTRLVEAKLDLHAQRKGSSSGLGRGLVAIKQAFDDAFSADLSMLWGKDLEKAQAKEVDKAVKKQKKKNKKKKESEKTDIDKAAEDSDLTPSAVDEVDPFTERMLRGLGQTKNVAGRLVDKVVEYGSANLLMGWKTQLINPAMNAVMMKLNNFETLGGGFFALLRGDKSAAARQARRAKYQSFAVVNHSRVASRAMWETLMTGYNKLDPDFKVKEEVDGATDSVAIGKGDIDFRKWKESLDEGMTFEDILGNYVRLSYRGLAAGDEFFKQLNFRGVYGGLVQEDLLASGKYVDLDDATFMKLLDSKIDEGVEILEKARKGEEALDEGEEKLLGQLLYSLQQTREATFTDKLGGVGSSIQKMMNDFPIIRLGMDAWFIRTPLNVFKYVGRRTPLLNFASRRSRRMLFGGNADDRDRALFELTFMTTAMLTLRQVVDEEVDVPDGKGGTIKMHRYQGTMDHLTYNNVKNLKLTGLQPHSVYFEDSQTFHNTMRFAPIDNLVMTLVNIRDLENAGMYDEGGELAAAALVSYMNMMKDTTFTSGMANFVEFMNSPEKKFENYVEAKGRTFTPAILKMMGTDEGSREVDGLWEAFKSGIPFMSKTMEPKFDRLGQPIIKPNQAGLVNGLSKATFLSNDPVRLEFLEMNADIADIPRKDGILDWESDAFVVDGKSAWWRFNEVYASIELGGKTLEETLEATVLSDEYQDIATISIMTPDLRMRGSKEAILLKVLNAYEDAAKYTVAKEREDLGMLEMWTAAQQARALSQSQQTMDQVETKPENLLDTFLNRNK